MATALKRPVFKSGSGVDSPGRGDLGAAGDRGGGGSDGGWTERMAWAGVWAEVAVGDCASSGEWRSPLRGGPLASGRGCAEEDGSWGHIWGSHLKRVEGLGFRSHGCGRSATWLFPHLILILPGSGFLTVLSPGFRLA